MISRKQKKQTGNTKTRRSDDSIPLTPEFNAPHVFDPWFNASVRRGPNSGHRDRFLFTFPDPANDISLDESEDVVEEEDDTMARPQTRSERLCDQILNAPMHSRKEKKHVNNKRVRSNNSNQGPSKKRRKTFSDVLDLTW